MFNNEEIYDRAVKSFNEVINEKVIAATESKEWAKFKFATLTKQKLREGAIKHEAQIPITLVECIKVNRDNLQEAIEEGIDMPIYVEAESVLQTQLDSNTTYEYLKIAKEFMYKAVFYLLLALFHDSKPKGNENE
tara:strand:+ start:5869 stop:6273 length:405 start_codon:yes stop_codon:yes gene_type:complete